METEPRSAMDKVILAAAEGAQAALAINTALLKEDLALIRFLIGTLGVRTNASYHTQPPFIASQSHLRD